MAVLTKIGKVGDYKNASAIKDLIRYVTRTRRNENQNDVYEQGALGVNANDPQLMINQFYQIQKVYSKTNGVRVAHEIVSFLDEEVFDNNGFNRINEIAYYYAAVYYLQGFQVVYAIHQNTDHWHIHFCINAVNFMDGRKYNTRLKDIEYRRLYLDQVIAICTGKIPCLKVIWDRFGYFQELKESCDFL